LIESALVDRIVVGEWGALLGSAVDGAAGGDASPDAAAWVVAAAGRATGGA
jgi:hypothetical protein